MKSIVYYTIPKDFYFTPVNTKFLRTKVQKDFYSDLYTMIRTRNQEKFDRYFRDLWGYLKQLYKEQNQQSSKNTKDLNHVLINRKRKFGTNDQSGEFMRLTLRAISPYIDQISRKDEFIFMPEFGNPKTKPLQFLPGFDFRKVWNLKNLTNENKKIIFRYLEFLYIQASLATHQNKEKVNTLVEAIRMEQEIAREAEENPNAFGDDEGGAGDFQSLFGDDETLMELVTDLKEEFNLEETFGEMFGDLQLQPGQNPLQAIQQMTANPNMQGMMENMAKRVHTKMEQKGISQEDLMKSAQNLQKNLAKNVSKMPGGAQIRRMVENLDMEKMAEQFQANQAGAGAVPANLSQDPNSQPPLSLPGMDPNQPQMTPDQMMQQMLAGLGQPGEGGSAPQFPPELQNMLQQVSQMHQQLPVEDQANDENTGTDQAQPDDQPIEPVD